MQSTFLTIMKQCRKWLQHQYLWDQVIAILLPSPILIIQSFKYIWKLFGKNQFLKDFNLTDGLRKILVELFWPIILYTTNSNIWGPQSTKEQRFGIYSKFGDQLVNISKIQSLEIIAALTPNIINNLYWTFHILSLRPRHRDITICPKITKLKIESKKEFFVKHFKVSKNGTILKDI
jgi:hypothetical protein